MGSTGRTEPVKFVPGGSRLVQALVTDDRLIFWDIHGSKSEVSQQSETAVNLPLARVSADGKWLFTISGNVGKVWSTSTGHEVRRLRTSDVFNVALGRDRQSFAWSTATGAEITYLDPLNSRKMVSSSCGDGDTSPHLCLKPDTDLNLLGFRSGGSLIFAQTPDVDTLVNKGPASEAVIYESDAGNFKTIRRRAIATRGSILTFFDSEHDWLLIAESPSLVQILKTAAPLTTATEIRRVRVIDWNSGEELRSLSLPNVSDSEITARVKATLQDNPEAFPDILPARIGWARGDLQADHLAAVAASPDGRHLAALSTFSGVVLWNTTSDQPIYQSGPRPFVNGKRGPGPTAMTFSDDGQKLLIGWDDGLIEVLRCEDGSRLSSWSTGDEASPHSPTVRLRTLCYRVKAVEPEAVGLAELQAGCNDGAGNAGCGLDYRCFQRGVRRRC